MTTAAVKTAIIAAVKDILPAWLVVDYPDQPSNYRLIHPIGAVLVQYGSSRYGPVETTDLLVQERTMHFGLFFVGRAQDGDKGVVTVLDAVVSRLPGQKTDYTGQIRCVSDHYVDETGGIWIYRLEVAADGKIIGQQQQY